MLPPDDTSPSNIIEILVANHQAKHTHTNKTALDEITTEKIAEWDNMGNHTHDEYATVDHVHDGYASQTDFDTLETTVNGKANASHTHAEYANVSHIHTASEVGAAVSGHNHDDDYADINHNHDTAYANIGHDHNEDYAAIDHTHTDYATVTSLNEVSATVSGKANVSHTHNDIYYTETEIDTKLSGKADSSHNHTGVYDASGAAANALTSANAYTDSKIDALVGEGASTTLDTIGEISSAIEDNQDAIDLLNAAIANKANASDLTSHTGNTTIHVTSTDKSNWNTAKTHADSAHAPSNAQPNQNAFSNVVVGTTTIAADTTTDTLTLVAGSNITLTPSSANDSVTIAATNTVYTHPTTAGNKHIPAGGSSGQILRWSADGTAVWGADNNTTYSVATQTANGLMSNTDKTKLDGIAEGANAYTHPTYTARTGVPTANATPAFGGTFSVSQPVSDATGHITAVNSRTITIPSSTASTSANGLMTSTDKTKLNYTNIAYGTCSTKAATAAKVITISGNMNWALTAGSRITVKFTNTNTASNPTFNVNGTGAKSVWYNTALITTSNLGYAGTANRPMDFVYDGTQYIFVGWSIDSNTTQTAIDGKLSLTGGTLTGTLQSTYIQPSSTNTYTVGTTDSIYSKVISKSFNVYGTDKVQYAALWEGALGTTSNLGNAMFTLGNGTASGTVGNAYATIRMYGTNTGYTQIKPGNNTTSNVDLTLPSVSGKIPIVSLSGSTLNITT